MWRERGLQQLWQWLGPVPGVRDVDVTIKARTIRDNICYNLSGLLLATGTKYQHLPLLSWHSNTFSGI